jgi:cysteine-rich repeat protein
MMRFSGLEGRVLHVTAAGNILEACPSETDAETDGRFQAAALLPLRIPNLSNMLVVENVVHGGGPTFEPSCLAESSKFPGHLAGIGTDVFSLTRAAGAAGDKTGTSMASPQVAGLAAYLWSLAPEMDVQELRQVLLATAHPVTGGGGQVGCSPIAPAPIIDAYAAVLALDAAALPDPILAPVRLAILDADESGSFNDADLVAFVDALIEPATDDQREPALPDFGRHDLNGDGFTGGTQRTARFDLDRIDSVQFGASGHGLAFQAIGGVDVPLDETQATDLDILCYYTYSDLFEGTDTARTDTLPFERCVRAATQVVFPAQVSPGTPTLLAVRVVAIGADSATRGPLAGVRVELSPSGGTVAAPSGITDAEGFFQTTATATPGATTFTIDIVVRRAAGSPELVQDFAQAAVVASGTIMVAERFADLRLETVANARLDGTGDEDEAIVRALPDFAAFNENRMIESLSSGERGDYTARASGSQATIVTVGSGSEVRVETSAAVTAFTNRTNVGVGFEFFTPFADAETFLSMDFFVIGGEAAFTLNGSVSSEAPPPDPLAGGATISFRGVSTLLSVGTSDGERPVDASGVLPEGAYTLQAELRARATLERQRRASWSFTLTLSPVIGTTSTSTSSSTTSTSSTSTLPSSSTTIGSTTSSTTTTTLFGLPVIPYARYAATGPDGPVVMLADEFVTETVDLGAVMLDLPPVAIDGELPFDPFTHQTCHAHPGGTLDACIDVQNRFGAAPLRIGNPVAVCARERFTAIGVDNFKCYEANGSALEVDVVLEDDFQSQTVTVGAPELLCTPVAVDEELLVNPLRYLVCYATTPPGAAGGPIEVDNTLHPDPIQVDVGVATGLCVPAVRQLVATCLFCGNGVVAGDEDCDDGGVLDGDGCSAVCQFELDCTCDGLPLPPPNEERCGTLADCSAFCTGCTAVGGVCGCQ